MRRAPASPRDVPRVSEKQVQAQIVDLLKKIGAQVWVLGTTRPRSDSHHGTCQTAGLADLWTVLPPKPYWEGASPVPAWIEVKAAGGRLRPEQHAFKAACESAGIKHIVGGLDDVLRYLAEGGWVKGPRT